MITIEKLFSLSITKKKHTYIETTYLVYIIIYVRWKFETKSLNLAVLLIPLTLGVIQSVCHRYWLGYKIPYFWVTLKYFTNARLGRMFVYLNI